MSRDLPDALIEQLLRETLGGDRPRDLTERVMARARGYDSIRRHWWWGTVSAAAASIAIVAGLWMLWPRTYTVLSIDSDSTVQLTNGDAQQRGARLVTGEDKVANIVLGGYARVHLEPQTALTLGGTQYAEKLTLEDGAVDVAVLKNRGQFDVIVGPATVHVTGTRFRVAVREVPVPLLGRVKGLVVLVKEGSVEVRQDADGSSDNKQPEPVKLDASSGRRFFPISTEPLRGPKNAAAPGVGPGVEPTMKSDGARGAGKETMPAAIGNVGRGVSTTAVRTGEMPRGIASRSFQVLLQPGPFRLEGTLRREGDVYFLDSRSMGAVLLFPKQRPLRESPNPEPFLGRRVLVLWTDGEAARIELLEKAATEPGAGGRDGARAGTMTRPAGSTTTH